MTMGITGGVPPRRRDGEPIRVIHRKNALARPSRFSWTVTFLRGRFARATKAAPKETQGIIGIDREPRASARRFASPRAVLEFIASHPESIPATKGARVVIWFKPRAEFTSSFKNFEQRRWQPAFDVPADRVGAFLDRNNVETTDAFRRRLELRTRLMRAKSGFRRARGRRLA